MEKFYLICGFLVFISFLVMTKKTKSITNAINTGDWGIESGEPTAVFGCLAVLAYFWLWMGLFTSQWFLCLVWILLGMIKVATKKLMHYKTTPRHYFYSLILDMCGVLFIVTNSLHLHIDFYQLFLSIF